jgi:hypothetical protein
LLDGLRLMIIKNILILTLIAALVPTAMSNVSASAAAEIALFSGVSDSDGLSISGNGDTAKMELKATNDNGKTNKVSDYQMNADNVLYIKVGDKVTVEDNVDFTKAITTDGNNNQKAIGITSNGVIDFTGYAQGVSTLDVVVDDDRAYEAVIVIGEHNQDTVKKEITTVNNIKRVTVCEGVIDNQTGACTQDPEPCDEGFVREGDECVPEPPIPCEQGFVREGDGCVPEPPIPCEQGFVREGDGCVPKPEPVATEEIDCELQPELCEVNFVEIPNVQLEETEEEELPEEEELTETTEFEEVEEESSEEEDSGGSDGEISE